MVNSTYYFCDRRDRRWYLFTLLTWLLVGGGLFAQTQESFFEPVPTAQARLAATTPAIPNAKLYKFNEAGLRNALINTAKQDEPGKTDVQIAIPLPNGTSERFTLRETQVLSPALAAANPSFKTYEGKGTIHQEYIIRMSLSSLGLEALIWGVDNDAVYFAKVTTQSGSPLYQSYYARDARKAGAVSQPAGDHHCGTISTTGKPELPDLKATGKGLRVGAGPSAISNGTTIRVFRIAIATTGEWTRNAGRYAESPNDLAKVRTNALAVVMSSVNRINGIYERELACRFTLVNPDTNGPDNIIFDNPDTDPYDNSDKEAQLTINQKTIDDKVKTANYDVGHLFGTGGGGVAASPSLCSTGVKAQGYSARGTNTGDPFVVDYFAHELGHQLDMKHTYNVIDRDGACTTRSAEEAYEVASGSTILSYVGICNAGRNLQKYNDFALPAFHISSITKATTYLASADVAGCGTTAGNTNTAPTVSAGSAYVIPRLTPFTLTATGADADAGDAANLLYSWEEFDLAPANGASGFGGTPSGVYDIDDDGIARPILRAYSPVKSPQRTFPSPFFILNPQNNATPGENQPRLFYEGPHPTGYPGATCPDGETCPIGERLPAIARTMNFRVSVRDLKGGVADAGMSVTVVNTPGAFRLTSFDSASTVAGNSQQTVTWNVVGTNQAPISCATVAIKLSTDGGLTFSTTLLASTPNDGSEVVIMPNNVTTTTARLRVEAIGNIFFDISNTNFSINPGISTGGPIVKVNSTDPSASEGSPNGGGRRAASGARQAAADPGFIQFERTTSQGTLVVNYVIGGTATNGVDFKTLPTSITFAEGQTVVIEELDPLEDDIVEGDETVVITLLDSDNYDPDPNELTTTLTIKDGTATPTAPFSITGVTTVSCTTVSAGERRLTFTPRYAGEDSSPISFSVANELRPTTSPGPYTLRVYTDNPTITLSAMQRGTASTFSYHWISMCTGGTTPPPTPPSSAFAITGVTTVSCVPVAGDANRRSLTFTPQFSGTTGQPISFSVVNELRPTTTPGPYTLGVYIDNPVITLKATQTGTAGEASFTYGWLATCNPIPAPSRVGWEPGAETSLVVRVLGNPIVDGRVGVEVEGVTGQPLQMMLLDVRGRVIATHRVEQSAGLETHSFDVGRQPVGTLLLRVATPVQAKTISVLKAD